MACDVAEVEPAASHDTRNVGDVAEVSEVAAEVIEPTAVEQVIESEAASDDLFPDLSSNDLVWVKVRLDTSVGAADTDCTSCPYCAGCRFEVVHRRLPNRQTLLLAGQAQPSARPRVRDGVAVWLDASSVIHVRDLDSAKAYRGDPQTWLGATPVPHGGKVWWWGYHQGAGYGLISFDYKRDLIVAEHGASILDLNISSGNLADLAREQPFSIDARGIVYANYDARTLLRWAFEGEAEELLRHAPDEARLLRGLTRADGRLVVLADDGDAHLMVDDEVLSTTPSRYVAPVVDGDRVVWLDFREGGYAVYGAGDASEVVRVSSSAAVIGAISSIAASDGRVVWSDHRSGRWRLMTRTW